MDEAKLAEIEAKSLRAVPKCSVCKAPARWTTGAYRMTEDFCEACRPKSRYPLSRIQFAELDSLDLVIEVRRLTAALATARREGAEEMRADVRRICAENIELVEGVMGMRDVSTASGAVLCASDQSELRGIRRIAREVEALPLDAPGGAT